MADKATGTAIHTTTDSTPYQALAPEGWHYANSDVRVGWWTLTDNVPIGMAMLSAPGNAARHLPVGGVLLDSGTTQSFIDSRIVAALGLQPTGNVVEVLDVRLGLVEAETYEVDVALAMTDADAPALLIRRLRVHGADIWAEQRELGSDFGDVRDYYHLALGTDVLGRFIRFSLDGDFFRLEHRA